MQKDKNITNIIKFPAKKSKFEREVEAIIFAADELIESIDSVPSPSSITLSVESIPELELETCNKSL